MNTFFINKYKVKAVNLKIIKMQRCKSDTVIIDQAYAKTSIYCNARLRNKRQKQKKTVT